jgi:hypothetical protein
VRRIDSSSNIELSWNANSESDVSGYKIYYGSPTGYSFTNVIDVGNTTSYVLHGVSIAEALAVTAYDNEADNISDQFEGHESWYATIEQAELTTCSISGYVLDKNGNAMTGASVSLSGSINHTTTTDQDGYYIFNNLIYGSSYTVSASENNGLLVSTQTLNFGKVHAGKSASLSFETTTTEFTPNWYTIPSLTSNEEIIFSQSINTIGTFAGTITASHDWIKVDPTTFTLSPGNNLIVVTATFVNNLTDGQYDGTITINSNRGNISVMVLVEASCILPKPNPFNPEKGPLSFFGSGIVPKDTKIDIYTISGEKIRHLEAVVTNDIIWDGKNEEGKAISNGIYLYTYESPREKGVGKFTVIRK